MAGTAGTRGAGLLFGAVNDELDRRGGRAGGTGGAGPGRPRAVRGGRGGGRRAARRARRYCRRTSCSTVRAGRATVRARSACTAPARLTELPRPPATLASPRPASRPRAAGRCDRPDGGDGDAARLAARAGERRGSWSAAAPSTAPAAGTRCPQWSPSPPRSTPSSCWSALDAAGRRALPANVRLVDWMPSREALPACAAVVHHGGGRARCSRARRRRAAAGGHGAGGPSAQRGAGGPRGAGLAAASPDITAGRCPADHRSSACRRRRQVSRRDRRDAGTDRARRRLRHWSDADPAWPPWMAPAAAG